MSQEFLVWLRGVREAVQDVIVHQLSSCDLSLCVQNKNVDQWHVNIKHCRSGIAMDDILSCLGQGFRLRGECPGAKEVLL
jgi:hypothetical protein